MDKKQLIEFMAERPTMVISTINSEGSPQSAVVGFAQTENCELIFCTSGSSRKANNIPAKSDVSAVIGWDMRGTVQYEGSAELLSGEAIGTYSEIYYAKHAWARNRTDLPEQTFFLIKPRWARYTDITQKPWLVAEIEL
jgi:pyridoxine/pyridoxamine 5'-phosphate oxidase